MEPLFQAAFAFCGSESIRFRAAALIKRQETTSNDLTRNQLARAVKHAADPEPSYLKAREGQHEPES